MLVYTTDGHPELKTYVYIKNPAIENFKWIAKPKDLNVFICDREVLLTEDLKTYLFYFNYPHNGGKTKHTLKSFSNLPIKEK